MLYAQQRTDWGQIAFKWGNWQVPSNAQLVLIRAHYKMHYSAVSQGKEGFTSKSPNDKDIYAVPFCCLQHLLLASLKPFPQKWHAAEKYMFSITYTTLLCVHVTRDFRQKIEKTIWSKNCHLSFIFQQINLGTGKLAIFLHFLHFLAYQTDHSTHIIHPDMRVKKAQQYLFKHLRNWV